VIIHARSYKFIAGGFIRKIKRGKQPFAPHIADDGYGFRQYFLAGPVNIGRFSAALAHKLSSSIISSILVLRTISTTTAAPC